MHASVVIAIYVIYAVACVGLIQRRSAKLTTTSGWVFIITAYTHIGLSLGGFLDRPVQTEYPWDETLSIVHPIVHALRSGEIEDRSEVSRFLDTYPPSRRFTSQEIDVLVYNGKTMSIYGLGIFQQVSNKLAHTTTDSRFLMSQILILCIDGSARASYVFDRRAGRQFRFFDSLSQPEMSLFVKSFPDELTKSAEPTNTSGISPGGSLR